MPTFDAGQLNSEPFSAAFCPKHQTHLPSGERSAQSPRQKSSSVAGTNVVSQVSKKALRERFYGLVRYSKFRSLANVIPRRRDSRGMWISGLIDG